MQAYVFKTLPEPTSAPVEPSWTMWPWYDKLLMAGIAVGAIAVLAALVLLLCRVCQKRKKKQHDVEHSAG